MDEDLDLLAGEYVLGTLSGEDLELFEQRLKSDAAAIAAVAEWRELLLPLCEGQAQKATPSDSVWEWIQQHTAPDQQDDMVTVRAEEGLWEILAPGVSMKNLHYNPVTRIRSYLVRLEAAARYAGHDHASDEECMMIEGDIRFGDVDLRVGDYHLVRKGIPHGPAYSENGALIFVRARTG